MDAAHKPFSPWQIPETISTPDSRVDLRLIR